MEVEIELKFMFNARFADSLYKTLDQFHCISNKTQFLHNVYFDTAERRLRQFDMGLRVRSCNGKSVQTIKTAGRVIGGLHQRPEYNEPIEGLRPELARFNDKIWPNDCDIKQLEDELTPIFSTDFERQTWLIELADDTLIEVAYDIGFIETNQGKVSLCEVELELIKGDEEQLFLLGNEIANIPEVRLGNVSKAQRGYMLADKSTFEIKKLGHSLIKEGSSIQQALLINMQHGLKQIQYHENCFIENGHNDALRELLKGIKFLHQNIILFKQEVSTLSNATWIEDLHWLARSFSWLDEYFIQARLLEDKAYYLRKLPKYKSLASKISQQQSLLPSSEKVTELLSSSRYCQFILTLTQWLIQLEKNTFSGNQNTNLKQFSSNHLDNAWVKTDSLFNHIDSLSAAQFTSCVGLLESTLLTELSLGTVFSTQKNEDFRSPWLDIKQGLTELSMLSLLTEMAVEEPDMALKKEYLKWIKRKQDSLLGALQQSKQQALLKVAYWQIEK